jgi:glycogen phosphorylase
MAQLPSLQTSLESGAPAAVPEAPRLRSDPLHLRRSFLAHVSYTRAKGWGSATPLDRFMAIAMATRDRLTERWVATQRTYHDRDVKRVCYLSAEYLLGRALGNNLMAMGLMNDAWEALSELGVSLEDLLEVEHDAGLGNGGLGRLAACFLDSMATLGYPGVGYGIR